mgnify:CR=1 FL=1|tara:strand:- start:631 stop:987 length:357 start_codon:yes stop_codon:yes gene_type:complete
MKVVWKIIFGGEEREITWFSSPDKPTQLDDDVMEFLEDYRTVYHSGGYLYNNSQAVKGKELYEMGVALRLFLSDMDRRWRKFRSSDDYTGLNTFQIISLTPRDPHFPEEKGTNNYTIY